MEKPSACLLVSAPHRAGEQFLRQLVAHKASVAALTNSAKEIEKWEALGVKKIVVVDTTDESTWLIPPFPIGKVVLFESSLVLSCRFIQICRMWTSEPITVVTRSQQPRLIYKGLGANYVVHSNTENVPFLLDSLVR
ncbi:hypothetical protein [Paenibacillus koleovorans]|uniref:hypothetical protein n=1 Tax=Paenibacillus koleovorans TaxID=121608 RepID=UPI000FDA2AF5|nr:hypothetical protein [Paenibacillus koleovorans]